MKSIKKLLLFLWKVTIFIKSKPKQTHEAWLMWSFNEIRRKNERVFFLFQSYRGRKRVSNKWMRVLSMTNLNELFLIQPVCQASAVIFNDFVRVWSKSDTLKYYFIYINFFGNNSSSLTWRLPTFKFFCQTYIALDFLIVSKKFIWTHQNDTDKKISIRTHSTISSRTEILTLLIAIKKKILPFLTLGFSFFYCCILKSCLFEKICILNAIKFLGKKINPRFI
jgi:hypothetical protein